MSPIETSWLKSPVNLTRSKKQGNTFNPRYCLFYDNHIMLACPDVGENFDVEAFISRIKSFNVDYLTIHARSNQGMALYDTKIGIKYPSLKYDLFGKIARACKREGIALAAYLNGGISSAEGLRNREWTTLYFDGRSLREPRLTAWVRTMCYNTPYRDHLISMVEEIATNYPVSGFFIDSLSRYPCVCPTCVKEMKERGINWNNLSEVEDFAGFSAIRLSQDITKAARAINPDFLLYFNGLTYEDQVKFGAYLEFEIIPTTGGYERMESTVAYMRALGDMPKLFMNTRFNNWRHFGGLRTEEAIKSELLHALANGMRPNVGGHFHPSEGPLEAALDRIEKIYRELQTMDPWFDDARNISEIAIVIDPGNMSDNLTRAAVRMLGELKHQFDVVTLFSDWSKYKVLVIPDSLVFDDEIARRVKAHLAAGKAVISSGSSGLDKELKRFYLENEWGIRYIGENDFNPAYFTVGKNFNKGLPGMHMQLFSTGIDVEALPGTSVEANLVKPYYNNEWDGEYAYEYCPPDKVTDKPALTINGKVAHFSHRIFSGYFAQAHVEFRKVFANVLEHFFPDPLIKYENLPSFSRVFVTEQPGRRMMHLLSYVPERRGAGADMIEEPVELHNVKISLRADGKKPGKVYLAPGKTPLSYTTINGYINVSVPVSKGYSLLVFEG